MFPFGPTPGTAVDLFPQTQLESKLRFLRSTRDDLEPRLAGINAAIEQIERQLSREDTAA